MKKLHKLKFDKIYKSDSSTFIAFRDYERHANFVCKLKIFILVCRLYNINERKQK